MTWAILIASSLQWIDVSSANIARLVFGILRMSFAYIVKSWGPKIDLSGTPVKSDFFIISHSQFEHKIDDYVNKSLKLIWCSYGTCRLLIYVRVNWSILEQKLCQYLKMPWLCEIVTNIYGKTCCLMCGIMGFP